MLFIDPWVQIFVLICFNSLLKLQFFGVPLAAEKTVFPLVSMEFLGITIDTSLLEFQLPVSELDKIRSFIAVLFEKEVRHT